MRTISDLTELVCRELPEDWELLIAMEKGAAVVNLYNPDGERCEEANSFDAPIDEQVLQAVAYAKAEHKEVQP